MFDFFKNLWGRPNNTTPKIQASPPVANNKLTNFGGAQQAVTIQPSSPASKAIAGKPSTTGIKPQDLIKVLQALTVAQKTEQAAKASVLSRTQAALNRPQGVPVVPQMAPQQNYVNPIDPAKLAADFIASLPRQAQDYGEGVVDVLRAPIRALKSGGLTIRGEKEFAPQGTAEQIIYGARPISDLAGYGRENVSGIGTILSGGQETQAGANIPENLALPLGALLAATDVNPVSGAKNKLVKDAAKTLTKQEKKYLAEATRQEASFTKSLQGAKPQEKLFFDSELRKIEARIKELGGTPKRQQNEVPKSPPAAVQPTAPIAPPSVPTVPKVPVKPEGKKQRGFVTSVKESDMVTTQTKRKTTGTYDPRSTEKLAANSEAFVGRLGNKAAAKDVNDRLAAPIGKIDDQTVSDALETARRLDVNKDYDGASQIYERLAEHGTKLGQSIQAFALLLNRSPDGIRIQAERSFKKAGIDVDDATRKQLTDLQAAIAKTKIGTEAREMAVHNMVKYVNSRMPTKLGSKITNIWRAGLLTAPTTTAGNILSNVAQTITKTGISDPVAAAADKAISLFTKKRAKTLTVRGAAAGTKEGLKRGGTFLKTGYDKRNPSQKYDRPDDQKTVNYGNSKLSKAIQKVTGGKLGNGKILQGYTEGIYRWQGAQDQPFYYATKQQSLYDQALAEAKNLKLKGNERKSFIDGYVAKPPRKALAQAEKDAEFQVFQNDTVLGDIAAKIKNAGWLGEIIVPFARVPAAVAMRLVDNTPIGTAREVVRQIASRKFDQRALSESIGRGAVGIPFVLVGASLAKNNEITLGFPDDPKEKALWEMEGKQPYSVKVGDKWLSMNYVQPVGTLMAIGAQFEKSMKEGKDTTSSALTSAGTASNAILNQSFLKGVLGTLEAVTQPERYAESFAENMTGSVVPNFIRSATRSADSVQRDVNGPEEALKGSIPGTRDQVRPKLDVFNRPLTAKASFADQFFNPFRPSNAKDDDTVVTEIRRLQDAKRGIAPSKITASSLGDDIKLNDEQIYNIRQNIGTKVYDKWGELMQDSRYKALSDEERMKVLRQASEDITTAYKIEWGVKNNVIQPNPKDLTTNQVRILMGRPVDFLDKPKTEKTPDLKSSEWQSFLKEKVEKSENTPTKKKKVTAKKKSTAIKARGTRGTTGTKAGKPAIARLTAPRIAAAPRISAARVKAYRPKTARVKRPKTVKIKTA